MQNGHRFSGVITPVLTPFKEDLSPDPERFLAHCQWLLGQGSHALAIFGTTSEANSLSVDERMDLLDALIEGGIEPSLLLPGTGCCALPDSVRLTVHAVQRGCGGVLMLPPFYYKAVSDDGLFRSIAEVIERVGDDRLRIYLYHIPPVAGVGFSLNLIQRFIRAYPTIISGVKDSSGDWDNTEAILKEFPGFGTFAGSEVFLLANLRSGGVGCITATGNVNVANIRELYDAWQMSDADHMQEHITALRSSIQNYPMVPALKHILAHFHNDPTWRTVRPPLIGLTDAQAEGLMVDLRRHGFSLLES